MVTKKVKSAGRFRQKYGRKVRLRITEIETEQRKSKPCPKCAFPRVKRVAAGIWLCRKCGHNFAGGAYAPVTPAGMGVDLVKGDILSGGSPEMGSPEVEASEGGSPEESYFEEPENKEVSENA